MRISISKAVSHDVRVPVRFAFNFAAKRAKQLGKKFNPHVNVTSCNADGRCFRGYWGRAFTHRNEVLLRFGSRLPAHEHRYARYQDMPTFELAGGCESIVYLAAHEFGHILGWPGDKCGEIACCKFGYAAVVAWREQQYEHPACLI